MIRLAKFPSVAFSVLSLLSTAVAAGEAAQTPPPAAAAAPTDAATYRLKYKFTAGEEFRLKVANASLPKSCFARTL